MWLLIDTICFYNLFWKVQTTLHPGEHVGVRSCSPQCVPSSSLRPAFLSGFGAAHLKVPGNKTPFSSGSPFHNQGTACPTLSLPQQCGSQGWDVDGRLDPAALLRASPFPRVQLLSPPLLFLLPDWLGPRKELVMNQSLICRGLGWWAFLAIPGRVGATKGTGTYSKVSNLFWEAFRLPWGAELLGTCHEICFCCILFDLGACLPGCPLGFSGSELTFSG